MFVCACVRAIVSGGDGPESFPALRAAISDDLFERGAHVRNDGS